LGGDRPCFDGGQAGFGVDQELARSDDLLALLQAGQYLGLPARFGAGLDLRGLVAALGERQHDERAHAGPDDGLGRHE
jgi:hypothetical protein